MGHIYSDNVEINAPCARVCAAMITVDKWSDWRKNLVDISIVSGSAFEQGLAWKEVRSIEGEEIGFDIVVTEFIEEESISLIVNGGKAGARRGAAFFEYRFVDYDSSTTIHLDSKLDRLGWMRPFISPTHTRELLDLYRSDLQGLKAYIENAEADNMSRHDF